MLLLHRGYNTECKTYRVALILCHLLLFICKLWYSSLVWPEPESHRKDTFPCLISRAMKSTWSWHNSLVSNWTPPKHIKEQLKKVNRNVIIMAYPGAAAHVEEQVVWLCRFHCKGECVEIAGGDFWFVRTHTVPVCWHCDFDLHQRRVQYQGDNC